MVTGFEQQTRELNKDEREKILPIIVKALKRKHFDEVFTTKDMVDGVNSYCLRNNVRSHKKPKVIKIDGPRIRKIVHHIRVQGLVPNLIATSKGYCTTNDRSKIVQYANSCRQRSNSFNEVYRAMLKHNNVLSAELKTK